MNQERLYEVIRYPHISEKTARLQAEANQYVFEVRKDATKQEIKRAVERLFNVNVEAIQVSNMKGKVKSFRFNIGRQSDWKKAYVRIRAGEVISDLQPE